MMLTGRVLDAATAVQAGLVQYLVPEGEAKSKAQELAAKMSSMAALRRELDGGTRSVRCGDRGAACGFRGKAGCQGDVARRVIDRCLAKRGFRHRCGS